MLNAFLFFSKATFCSRTSLLWSQLTEHAPSRSASVSADGQQPPEVGWGHSAEAGMDMEGGPVNSGPPPLAPEGDQQFSAGCLASVLTH